MASLIEHCPLTMLIILSALFNFSDMSCIKESPWFPVDLVIKLPWTHSDYKTEILRIVQEIIIHREQIKFKKRGYRISQ